MDTDKSDPEDDPGRRESERRLRNEMGSKFLDEVIEKTGMDYDEAVETIEREKKARDTLADGAAAAYSMDLRIDAVDWYARSTRSMPTRPKPASGEATNYLKAREEDKERVKGELAAGKRVADGERRVVEGGGAPRDTVQFHGLENGGGVAKVLKGMQKGVKRATEGMQ